MPRVFAYARVSTREQNLQRQTDALSRRGYDLLYTETASGARAERPQLTALRAAMLPGDTLLVESFSRLSRSTKELLALVEELSAQGIQIVSLKENLDTATPTGRLMLTMLAALAQFERDLLAERTGEGLAAARARGRVGGRPKVDPKKVEQAVKLYRAHTLSVRQICELTGVSPSTLYRRVRGNQGPPRD